MSMASSDSLQELHLFMEYDPLENFRSFNQIDNCSLDMIDVTSDVTLENKIQQKQGRYFYKALIISLIIHAAIFFSMFSLNYSNINIGNGSEPEAIMVSLVAGPLGGEDASSGKNKFSISGEPSEVEAVSEASLATEISEIFLPPTSPEAQKKENTVPPTDIENQITLKEKKQPEQPKDVNNNNQIKPNKPVAPKQSPQSSVRRNKIPSADEAGAAGEHGTKSGLDVGTPGTAKGPGASGGQSGTSAGYVKGNYDYIKKRIKNHLVYSPQAKRMGLKGVVTVSFIIEKNGQATNIKVSKSSGYEALDQSALAAVKNSSPFPPPPETARVLIPIVFNLK